MATPSRSDSELTPPPPPGAALSPARRLLKRVALIAYAIVIAAMLGYAFLPSLLRPTQPAGPCASNLRQIYHGLQLYADDNGGGFPPSFEELLVTEDMTSMVFVSPGSDDTPAKPPPGAGDDSKAAVAREMMTGPHHLSYAYCIAGLTKHDLTAKHVVAYDLHPHGRYGIHVLYGDGHVELVDNAAADRIIAELNAGHNPPRAR